MENVGKILLILVFGYLGWTAYSSWKNKSLIFPLFKDDPDSGDPANPDDMAQKFHKYFREQSGFKAIVHPDLIHDRDLLLNKAITLDNDTLKALYAAYNKRYSGESKGSFTKVINDAAGDPFNKFNLKTSFIQKLRVLNCN